MRALHFNAIFNAALATVAMMLAAVSKKSPDPGPASIDAADATVIPPLTASLVQKYAYSGASDVDIADRFLTTPEAIRFQFTDALRSARGLRRIMIHSYQTDLAKKANASILTWIGRNELGQSLTQTIQGKPEPKFGEADGE